MWESQWMEDQDSIGEFRSRFPYGLDSEPGTSGTDGLCAAVVVLHVDHSYLKKKSKNLLYRNFNDGNNLTVLFKSKYFYKYYKLTFSRNM